MVNFLSLVSEIRRNESARFVEQASTFSGYSIPRSIPSER